MLNIYINTWGNYNENGADNGEWITLPMDEDELEEKLEAVAEAMGDNDPEWFVNDYEWTTEESFFEVNEMDNYFKLNERLEELGTITEYEQAVLLSILDVYTNDFDEAVEILQSGNYIFYQGAELSDVAYEQVQDYFTSEIPQIFINHFNYDSYERELTICGYRETKWGVILSC